MSALPALIEVPYLDKRDYVHGTTLFTRLLPYMREGRDISFKIGRLARKRRLALEAFAAERAAGYCCTCHWRENGAVRGIGVAEIGDAEHPSHDHYDEEAIVALARFSGRSAQIVRSSDHAFIELVVAVNKALLQRTLGEHVSLLFTRLDIGEIPLSPVPLTITYEREMGMRHFASCVDIAGRTIGQLYFSRRAP
jgi:hypothetical protein